MRLARRHLRLLHALLVAWVLAGMVLQPVMAALGDLHALEHRSALVDGHGHAHGSEGHDHHAPDPVEGDGSHGVSVLHGLLHACSGASAAALFDAPTVVGSGVKGSDPPLAVSNRAPSASLPNSPFRPPIA